MPGKIGFVKILFFIIAAGGGAAFFLLADPVSTAPPKNTTATGRSIASRGKPERRFLPEAGAQYHYSFQRKILFQGNLGGANLAPVSYSGEFNIHVLEADHRHFEAIVTEKIDGNPPPRHPLLRFIADADGKTISLFTRAELNEEEEQFASIAKDLLSLWLFPIQSDTVGRYQARFSALPAEAPYEQEKKEKVSYESLAPNTPKILFSEHFLTWDASLNLPRKVLGEEKSALGQEGSALIADTSYEIRFVSKSTDSNVSLEKDHLAIRASLALDLSRAKLNGHPEYTKLNWDSILDDLKGLDRMSGMQQLNVFGDAVRYLRMHPEKMGELRSLLMDSSSLEMAPQAALFRNIVGILATLGSAEALSALRDAFDSPSITPSGKLTILGALTTTEAALDSVTQEFLRLKMEHESDPRIFQSAGFALGSSLQKSDTGPETGSCIGKIKQTFQDAQSESERNAALDMMGNSGREEFFSTIQQTIENNRNTTGTRAKAIFALRFNSSQPAIQELSLYLGNGEESLRDAAAEAIHAAKWQEAFRHPLDHCKQEESVKRIRDLCGQILNEHPQVAKTDF